MVQPYWVCHLCVTSAHFGPAVCLGLWLIDSVQIDCVRLLQSLFWIHQCFSYNAFIYNVEHVRQPRKYTKGCYIVT